MTSSLNFPPNLTTELPVKQHGNDDDVETDGPIVMRAQQHASLESLRLACLARHVAIRPPGPKIPPRAP